MPSGAAVIRYAGKRGVVWRIKYRDATGCQVQETVGRERDGWTEAKAQRELGKRLEAVEKGRWRKLERLTFAAFADRFENEHLPARNLKGTTTETYKAILGQHLTPYFGKVELAGIEPELIDRYVGAKSGEGLSAKSITNHLLLLNTMLRRAVKWRLIPSNPVEAVDRPRVRTPDMNIVTETEIARLWTAYGQEIGDADEDERPWWTIARTLTFVALGTALRRGELLGARWRDVSLLEGRWSVRETFVRGKFTEPKSEASRRTIELGPKTVELLQDHWRASAYQGDDELVFAHPTKGTPLDSSKIASYMRKAIKRAGITKPVRAFHDLRHSSLTASAAAGNPAVYVQARAGHSQASTTERYVHASQVLFPGAAEAGEKRLFGALGTKGGTKSEGSEVSEEAESPDYQGFPSSGGRI